MKNSAFIEALTSNLRGEVLADDLSLGMYATDASMYQITPVAVAMPKDTEDVLAALRIANEHNVSILPRGGGTSLAGQTVGHSLVLDFSRHMHQVLELNTAERWVRVQPGISRDDLNAALTKHNLHFAPDPATSSRANIGGMVGNNSSGTKSILYGKTVDHVIAMKAALADGAILDFSELSPEAYQEKAKADTREGEIYREFQKIVEANRAEVRAKFPKVMRRVGGYNLDEFTETDRWNLSKILVGSEGTLALTLEVTINLEPLPKYKAVCAVHFSALRECISTVQPMLKYRPAAIEIIDNTVIEYSRKNLTTMRSCHFVEGDPAAILVVEFYDDTEDGVLERPRQMAAELASKKLGYAWPIFPEGKEYDDVWTIRKKGLGLMLGLTTARKPLAFIEDAAIPVEVLPDYIAEVAAICKKHETEAAMYAHASVGVIHVRPILDLRQQADIDRMKNIADETFELVKKYGGAWSGEHGDGLVRSAYNERFFGPQLYQAFKQVKALFDPDNRMNPGKILDAQQIDENLRYGGGYEDSHLTESHFHFRQEGSFENAVHTCTGVGECRKMLGGTMCPSFKATRDEADSTRGRANALRLAISGQFGSKGLLEKEVADVLDLCLSCKACKSECPSNVDMAKMKSEVQQKQYDAYGITLQDRFIRDSRQAAERFSGFLAPFVNGLQKSRAFRAALEKTAGFDRRRILPDYARQPFTKWYQKNYRENPANEKKVVLFADTYLNYYEPNIGKAAVELLQSCGYEVLLADAGCCQRPKISRGFLRDAKKGGAKTAAQLDDYLQQNLDVLVCEPSCASALNDDLPDLLDNTARAARMKKQIMTPDVFLQRELASGALDCEFEAAADNAILHEHCHQKALIGTKPLETVLGRAGNLSLKTLPSGCCGMAGAFGYEKKHYDISEKIGSQTLFPAVETANGSTEIIANGFSCRHQISHFTGKTARHWLEVIRKK